MTFKNPIFGNTFVLDAGVTIKRTMDGSLIVDTHKNQIQSFHMEFVGLTQVQRDSFLEYLISTAGQEIVVTDHEGFKWQGFILDKEPRFQTTGQGCLYNAQLTFEGYKQ